ncbi:unnamed protein product [Arabidopsis thaliana]|uniref:J domain-containing protein n=1 Tax=Arabidopsis thaliana TaxID=3702 RepID=A0A654F670_ARATH|nr:unnamed protein product [Arabidopsis thaliana]
MGKIRPGPDPKAALVSDILALSRSPISCIHINRISSGSCFIDWYLILGIQEDAEVKVIRKRYHKLALKVHPDKNNHPKADIAFKLIHEDIRDKFREENMVIERCLKTNSAFFMGNRTNKTPPVYGIPKQNRINKESPVFNPSDYRLWGYPHVRNRVFDYNLSSDWNMFTRSRSTCVHSS